MPRPGWTHLVLVAALGLSACAAPEGRPPQPAPASDATATPAPTGRLVLVNDSPATIFRVRFSAVNASDWGRDRLEGAEVIKAGAQRSWEVPSATYHVKVEFRDGSSLDGLETYAVPAEGEATCRIRGPDLGPATGMLTLTNATGWAIASVTFSLTTDMAWGDERLGPREVWPPRRRRSWQIAPGSYNLRLLFQDGVALEPPGPFTVVAGEERIYRIDPPEGS